MNPKFYFSCLLFATLGLAQVSQAEPATPVEVVQTLEHNAGVHHGYRRNHAKGLCATGEFTASAEAKNLSRSILFDGKPHSVVARFSAAGGVPTVPDSTKLPRGMALEFDLGGGSLHNMSMINAPFFLAATPEAFLESLKAGTPEKLEAYMKKYPESKPFFAWVTQTNPIASYATSSYYSLNAFKFLNAANKEQFVRWHFSPEAGEKTLSATEVKTAKPNYLEDEFASRLKKGPAQWTMIVTLAEAGDSTTNSTSPWPTSRKTLNLGTLKLSKYEAQSGGVCDKINFDPTRVSDGVEVSDDPILKFRSPAYAISYGKRLSDPKDPAPAEDSKPKRKAIEP